MHDDMLSIGQISKIVDISTDTLRYYDEVGLLKPSFIDQSTKYRYYTELQLNQLTRILELKQSGFSLDVIKLILNKYEDESLLQELYKTKLYELEQEKDAIDMKIKNIKKRILVAEGNAMNKTVLIVEDVEFMSKTIKEILERDGYSVISQAYNGIIAVEEYKKYKPNIVVMDITMPLMDGIQALREIIEYDKEAKVVMCTAYWQPNMILRSIQAGACGYILKPFYPDAFSALLDEAVNSHGFDKQAINELLEDQRLISLSKKNLIIIQETVQKIVNACRGGEREFIETLNYKV